MAIEITIPRLGWNMEEGLFVGWLKRDGEPVNSGEALFCLETDKATQEVECLDNGVLRILPNGPKDGDKLVVGTVIGYLTQPGEALPFANETKNAPPESAAQLSESSDGPSAISAVREQRPAASVGVPHAAGTGSRRESASVAVQESAREESEIGRRMNEAGAALRPSGMLKQTDRTLSPAISPRAKRVARELDIDWTRLQGTGQTGRIREQDVRAAAAKSPIDPILYMPSGIGSQAVDAIPITPIRQKIAERLLTSVRSTVPVTLTTTADATNLVHLRRQFKVAVSADNGLVPTFTDILVKLTAVALREHALLNARWGDKQILVARDIHIGIAVDTEDGLLVPVIHDVPSLSLKQLAIQSHELIERARQRRLKAEDMQGGTFTVSNLGTFGIDGFTPIINYPECAILGIGRIRQVPSVVGERIVAVEQLALSLTFDHRIVDGAPAARFLQTLSRLIENPCPALIS